jgi:hypothetical protein
MGQESSKFSDREVLPVVTLAQDIDLPEVTDASQQPETAAPPPPPGDSGGTNADSLDQLPSVPATATDSARSAIVRDLGDYRLEKVVLGEGAFGKVRLATSITTAHRVAVKVIKRKKLNERAEVLLQREVKHHEKVSAPLPPPGLPRRPRRPRRLPPTRRSRRWRRSCGMRTSCGCTRSS